MTPQHRGLLLALRNFESLLQLDQIPTSWLSVLTKRPQAWSYLPVLRVGRSAAQPPSPYTVAWLAEGKLPPVITTWSASSIAQARLKWEH